MSKFLLISIIFVLTRWTLGGPTVTIPQGSLEGGEGQDIDGNQFYKFLGIPYAKPPVGDLRFKEPVNAESWEGVRNATVEGSSCVQKSGGSEDCLYLNVYTRNLPTENSTDLKAVMVWIHGGSFTSGSGSPTIYGPEFLLTEDVIVVSINYRLGLLGFIRFKNESLGVPGNMGFKDQVKALEWVQNNIVYFNGDPNNVTIFGESAGSASVHYHVLSPLSIEFFQKAILQSGAALDSWADDSDHDPIALAQLLNPLTTITSESEALSIFQQLSAEAIFVVQSLLLLNETSGSKKSIGLSIEPPSPTAFISRNPIDIITSGEYNQVPLIIGYNNREGILFNAERKQYNIEAKPEYFVPHNVDFYGNETERQYYLDKIQEKYLSGSNDDDNVIDVMTDAYFVAGIIGSAQNHARTSASNVYLYKLSLDTQLNFMKIYYGLTEFWGASHGDDLGYLFKTLLNTTIESGSVEETSLRRLVKLWTNFAKYDNPTPELEDVGITWPAVSAEQLNTLHIDANLTVEVNPESETVEFWKELFQQSNITSEYLH
ncbi:esterase FE4-like [Sitophilus oryzae]|uniref:Esterase FE4-like n=1 Tax=Sitophilus oryzae TaxID=7048 RepID=A0A6J2XS81_SITOR|nr:esterase FE4-like [Sitophilus oryzae]